jgi:aspartyl/glutamyl-tRNA(Asn/Gln) amidotransferase C subunit
MDQETVSTICYLARLEIDKNKSEKIKQDLETIIELIGSLQTIDTSSIEPLYSPLEMTALTP